ITGRLQRSALVLALHGYLRCRDVIRGSCNPQIPPALCRATPRPALTKGSSGRALWRRDCRWWHCVAVLAVPSRNLLGRMKAMRTKPISSTLFVGSLVVAAIAGTRMMAPKDSATNEPKAYVLATTMPLPQGTLLREQDVTWQGVNETKPGQVVRPTASQLEA